MLLQRSQDVKAASRFICLSLIFSLPLIAISFNFLEEKEVMVTIAVDKNHNNRLRNKLLQLKWEWTSHTNEPQCLLIGWKNHMSLCHNTICYIYTEREAKPEAE